MNKKMILKKIKLLTRIRTESSRIWFSSTNSDAELSRKSRSRIKDGNIWSKRIGSSSLKRFSFESCFSLTPQITTGSMRCWGNVLRRTCSLSCWGVLLWYFTWEMTEFELGLRCRSSQWLAFIGCLSSNSAMNFDSTATNRIVKPLFECWSEIPF